MKVSDMPVARCSSCSAKIVWVKTKAGKNMPLDVEPVADGNIHIDHDGIAHVDGSCATLPGPHYKSHFATCPNSRQHRKK